MKNFERSFPNKSPWTREEVARLRELLNDGVPFDEIVTEVGHTKIACQNKAHLQGYSTTRSRQAGRNPFLNPQYGPGIQTVSAAERIEDVKKFTAAQCRAALRLPDLQATVRQAIERRQRQLCKDASHE